MSLCDLHVFWFLYFIFKLYILSTLPLPISAIFGQWWGLGKYCYFFADNLKIVLIKYMNFFRKTRTEDVFYVKSYLGWIKRSLYMLITKRDMKQSLLIFCIEIKEIVTRITLRKLYNAFLWNLFGKKFTMSDNFAA